ncbi:MAG: type II toxin-antitoxin system VapC family toxin [Akkermansiaceae bacterium]|nr:type II toxin-antitoxin system VapC family toxin [Akkermansiaceae bacterium]MCF7732141.1 type II toxin-antitoxin system VapC family toxin [Akkermansiaceae bacterium]
MILPDVNLLIYAHNLRAPQHRKALAWWNRCLEGPEGVALAWVVIQGFVRITTHPKIFEHPMPVEDALGRVEEWLILPHVQVIHPPQTHFKTWSSFLKQVGSAGNLTTDAHLAALATDRALTLHSTDADFYRFPGLKWRNPLT